MPGPLKVAAGFHYQEFSNLKKPLALRGDPFGAGKENKVTEWAEMIVPDSAKALAFYEHPFFGKLCLAKTSYTRKMNDLAQSSIRNFPLSFLP